MLNRFIPRITGRELRRALVCLAIAMGVVLGYVHTRPDTLHLERATTVAASSEQILPLLTDFRRWHAWSRWGSFGAQRRIEGSSGGAESSDLDSDLKQIYLGPESGKGAVYLWGSDKRDSGRLEILSATTRAVAIKVDWFKPQRRSRTVRFELEPNGPTTRVVVTLDETRGLFLKLILALNPEGADKRLEEELKRLKRAVEQLQA